MGWIDLMGNSPMTQAQLDKRNSALIRSKYTKDREDMINRMLSGSLAGMYTMSEDEQALVAEYSAYCKEIQAQRIQARDDSILLQKALEYEKAQQRLAQYILSEGVEAQDEIPAVIDEDTGEIITEAIPAVIGIDPLPPTVMQNILDDEGNIISTEEIPNPEIVEDEAERAAAQDIIDNASEEVINLVNTRN